MTEVRHQLTRGRSNKEIPGFPGASTDFNREIKAPLGGGPKTASLQPAS